MKENEEEDIHTQTDNILKKIQEQMLLTEEALNSVKNESLMRNSTSQSMSLPSKKQENKNIIRIKDSSLEFVNLEQNFSQKPDNAPFDDCCSLCSSKIYYISFRSII